MKLWGAFDCSPPLIVEPWTPVHALQERAHSGDPGDVSTSFRDVSVNFDGNKYACHRAEQLENHFSDDFRGPVSTVNLWKTCFFSKKQYFLWNAFERFSILPLIAECFSISKSSRLTFQKNKTWKRVGNHWLKQYFSDFFWFFGGFCPCKTHFFQKVKLCFTRVGCHFCLHFFGKNNFFEKNMFFW